MPAHLAQRRLLLVAALCLMAPAGAVQEEGAAPGAGCAPWPEWERFRQRFISADGRVIDPFSPRLHTVSEGQAYALFFALVAGDRRYFERVLRWTEDNLAAGDLLLRLPAWQWGRRDDGSWGVVDAHPAADADLWMAYALGEAGRLWKERRYEALSAVLLQRILAEETAAIPGWGLSLLPGAQGFAQAGRWRLNPSYTPPFLLAWAAQRGADPRWGQVRDSAQRLLVDSAPRGFAPDWVAYRLAEGAAPGAAAEREAPAPGTEGRTGGYDAIRVYLWTGMTAAADPARAALLQRFAPMADLVARDGQPPEHVDAVDGSVQGVAGAGFTAALLPFLEAQGRGELLAAQEARLRAMPDGADAYYEQALRLFALGWRARRFAFGADGALQLAASCRAAREHA